MQYPDRPAILLAGRSALHKQSAQYPNPRPARRRSRDAQHLRGLGSMTPAGVQRAAPSGARRKGAGAGQNPAAVRAGRRPGEGQESRGQRPLVHAAKARVQGRALPLSAQDAAPARGGSPEGRALWCTPQRRGCRAEPCRCPRRTPPRRGAGVQRAEPFGVTRR